MAKCYIMQHVLHTAEYSPDYACDVCGLFYIQCRLNFEGISNVARGGARAGAGRKGGAAWNGKKPRTIRDMASSRVRQVLDTANDPLAILVEIANDADVDVALRVQAASAAAPYMFPRLSASVVATAPASARDDTAGLVDRLMNRFARLAPPVPTIEGELTCPSQMEAAD